MRTSRKSFFTYVLLFLLGVVQLSPGLAQNKRSNRYFVADRLLQQQKYEQAYQIFHQLYQENPNSYMFFEKATECLINLKRYDEAVSLSQKALEQNTYARQAGTRLGEIYHMKGDTARAFEMWEKIRSEHPGNLQVMLNLAQTMRDRKAYHRSIRTYLEAKQQFPGSSTIAIELAYTYMQSGEYESAIEEYLFLLRETPDRINFVQNRLLQFNDDYLYDIAILEIDEFLDELSTDHPSHRNLINLQLWLLMERKLYKRALTTAKKFEESRKQVTYTLYSLGAKFLSERKFKLAHKAYNYYIEHDIYPAKVSSMEELALVNTEWADYLADYNLANSAKRDSLYREAFRLYSEIQTTAPNYRNLSRVLIEQSEIALDHLHDPEIARKNLSTLESIADSSNLADRKYIEGRIKLYEEDYSRARIAFTKGNKQEQIGDLAQKIRYYLALTDFYGGDYEFAKIQLNALERQNTSYFANDAVQLRVWIQEGLQQDSTGESLNPYASAVEAFSRGRNDEGLEKLTPVLGNDSFHPLEDEALLELSSSITTELLPLTYTLITKYLQGNGKYSPLRERLMWEKVRIADQAVNNGNLVTGVAPQHGNAPPEGVQSLQDIKLIPVPEEVSTVITLYEDILLEYPQGFYSSYARNRIQELEKIQS